MGITAATLFVRNIKIQYAFTQSQEHKLAAVDSAGRWEVFTLNELVVSGGHRADEGALVTCTTDDMQMSLYKQKGFSRSARGR